MSASPAPKRPQLAVVIPAYNEEGAVRATVDAVRAALDGAGIAHEILVVDDGSTDGTSAAARASGARLIGLPANIGYGHALKTGIASSDSDFVAILDADGTYPPAELPRMLELAAEAEMVVGDRGARMNNVPFVRRPAKWFLKLLASVLARRRIDDVNSGLRVFRRDALVRFVPLLPDGYSFTTTITLCMLASNLRVIYHPIQYGRRIGHSKIRARHFFKFVFLVLWLTLFFQPLRIFAPLGVLILAGGAGSAWLAGEPVLGARATTFGAVGAGLAIAVGMVVDYLAASRRRRRGFDLPRIPTGPA